MTPDKTRADCAGCAGFISCMSSRRKYNIYKREGTEPAHLAHLARDAGGLDDEDEKGPERTSSIVQDRGYRQQPTHREEYTSPRRTRIRSFANRFERLRFHKEFI